MIRDRFAIDLLQEAATWRQQAGVLRRRAARPNVSDEARAEGIRRAEWYERRATVVDEAHPQLPIFPHDLRTPADELDLVDDVRRSIETVLSFGKEIGRRELTDFRASLRRAAGEDMGADLVESADDRTFLELVDVLQRLASLAPLLGVNRGLFADYDVELIDVSARDPTREPSDG